MLNFNLKLRYSTSIKIKQMNCYKLAIICNSLFYSLIMIKVILIHYINYEMFTEIIVAIINLKNTNKCTCEYLLSPVSFTPFGNNRFNKNYINTNLNSSETQHYFMYNKNTYILILKSLHFISNNTQTCESTQRP